MYNIMYNRMYNIMYNYTPLLRLAANIRKNRYSDILAYDHTRVKLQLLPNDPFSDYVNANYVDGYNQEQAFIFTQGPLPHTLGDFWRMVSRQGGGSGPFSGMATVVHQLILKTRHFWVNICELACARRRETTAIKFF